MEAPALIRLRQAGVRFGAIQALDAIDVGVRRGECIALVGANGSGKTTLLRLLHGLQGCTTGAREVPAHVGRLSTAGLRCAMVFQRPFLLNLSVNQNLNIALWLRAYPRQERLRRAGEALERMGLVALAQRPARTLSGGQQQRLALAIAWSTDPDVLFLDEPTANLDPGAKREVEAAIAQLASEGLTLVMSTHNLGQAKRLASRVLYLENGRLLVDAPVDQFFQDRLPASAEQFLKGERSW